jgi:hypothetical protein
MASSLPAKAVLRCSIGSGGEGQQEENAIFYTTEVFGKSGVVG